MRYVFLFLFAFVSLSSFAADLDQLIAKANAGDATAQYQLGTLYNAGDGVGRSPDQAFAWFQKAARQGHLGAMYSLGMAYYNGDTLGGTIPTDVDMAWAYFSIAADMGERDARTDADRVWSELNGVGKEDAQLKLADVTLALGDRVPDRGARVTDILRRLAQQGSGEAKLRLAQMYLDGKIVPRDLVAAGGICRGIAKTGVGNYCLGLVNELNDPPNYAESAKFYEKAARMGDLRGMYKLALFYVDGKGVRQDQTKAYMWAYLAANYNAALARTLVANLEPKLSPKEIDKGRKDAAKIHFPVPNSPIPVLRSK